MFVICETNYYEDNMKESQDIYPLPCTGAHYTRKNKNKSVVGYNL